MDAELKEFLEKLVSNIEKKIDLLRSEFRSDMAEMEDRLNARIEGVGHLSKDAARTVRTRDFRILVLEERVNEVEKRLLDVEGQRRGNNCAEFTNRTAELHSRALLRRSPQS